ncbi:MAG: hypothetical protein ACRD2J_15490 [Thermoanaerobaculia bacterium]
MRALLTLSLAVLTAGCVIHTNPPVAPAEGACNPPPSVTGVWSWSGLSQAGPMRTTMTLGCDCTASFRSLLLWALLRSPQRFEADDQTIVLHTPEGQQTVRYEREEDALLLTWPGGELQRFELRKRLPCE